jgi:sugar phosphate isomerase/epimerase
VGYNLHTRFWKGRMRQKLGVFQATFQDSEFRADVELTARCGLEVFSPTQQSVQQFGARPAKRLLRDAGLSAGTLGSLGGFLAPGREKAFVERARTTIDLAAALDCPTIAVTPYGPPGLDPAEADRRMVEAMRRVVPLAEAAGVRLTLEPSHPILHFQVPLNTLQDALAVCDEVEGLQILVDTSHVWWDRRFLPLFRENVDRIGAVQLSNVSEEGLRGYRYDRPEIVGGAISLAPIVKAMDAAGYGGYYEIELLRFFPQTPESADGRITGLPREECERVLREAAAWWQTLWEEDRSDGERE